MALLCFSLLIEDIKVLFSFFIIFVLKDKWSTVFSIVSTEYWLHQLIFKDLIQTVVSLYIMCLIM